jgi:hypothetical protein
MSSKGTIDVNRLFAAADALLDAMSSHDGADALIQMYAGNRPDATGLPANMFTQAELVEAMAMLVRMGYSTRSVPRR